MRGGRGEHGGGLGFQHTKREVVTGAVQSLQQHTRKPHAPQRVNVTSPPHEQDEGTPRNVRRGGGTSRGGLPAEGISRAIGCCGLTFKAIEVDCPSGINTEHRLPWPISILFRGRKRQHTCDTPENKQACTNNARASSTSCRGQGRGDVRKTAGTKQQPQDSNRCRQETKMNTGEGRSTSWDSRG